MEKLYKVSEIARMLYVSTVAVRKWIGAGKLNARKVGKLWMIPESELKNFLGEKSSEVRAVIYARSSHKQKKDGNLDRQVERLKMYCSARGYRVIDVITDIASGLKEDRSGLQKLFEIVEKRQADVVVVEFEDRLTRFGFGYIKRCFESQGVRIEVVEESEKGYMEELVEDFVSVIMGFAARIYGKRSQKFMKIKKVVEEVVSDIKLSRSFP